MTNSLPLSVPATQIPHTHVRRQDLSQLVAGLPGLLGASPVDSLVLYTFGRGPDLHLATTLVGVLPPPSAVDSLAARALAAARLTSAVAVIAVVVGGVAASPQPGPLPYRDLVNTLRRMFDEAGIVLVHASWVRRATPGEPWRCYDDLDCYDMVPDEASTTLAAAATVAGVTQFSTRKDLARLLVPDDQEHLDRRSRLFDAHLKRPNAPYTGELLAMDLQLIKDTIEEAAKSPDPPVFSDSHLVRLAHALAHEEVRDDCLAIALSPDADAAERVWLSLVRALPAPERAEAGFLLAISTYLRGEVVVAALAMEAALDANPGHPMASVLRANLCAGTPPTHLRAMLIEAVIRATEQRATLALFDDNLDEDDDLSEPPWITDTPRRPADPAGTTPTTEQRPEDSVGGLFLAGIHASELAVPTPAALPELPDLAGWQPSLSTLFGESPVDEAMRRHPSSRKSAAPNRNTDLSEPRNLPEFPDMLLSPPAGCQTVLNMYLATSGHSNKAAQPEEVVLAPADTTPLPQEVEPRAQETTKGMAANDIGSPPSAPEMPDVTGMFSLLAPGSPRAFPLPVPVSDPRGPG